GIDFFGFQQPQQGGCDQYVAKFLDEPHHTGCDHLATKNGPVKNICVSNTGLATQIFDACAMFVGFKWFTPPKFLNHHRTQYRYGEQENEKIGNFASGGSQEARRPFKRQDVNKISKS
ncbi:MAG: hypothetical protein GWN16_00425, partial [Calditrichae bacterium]|nr:hypothetical protein [Calditrichia bacterium]